MGDPFYARNGCFHVRGVKGPGDCCLGDETVLEGSPCCPFARSHTPKQDEAACPLLPRMLPSPRPPAIPGCVRPRLHQSVPNAEPRDAIRLDGLTELMLNSSQPIPAIIKRRDDFHPVAGKNLGWGGQGWGLIHGGSSGPPRVAQILMNDILIR